MWRGDAYSPLIMRARNILVATLVGSGLSSGLLRCGTALALDNAAADSSVVIDAIAVPDQLKLDGVPAIPQSIADEVARYTEFRGASVLSWHPTERSMLMRTRFGNTSQAHVLAGPGMARQQITFLPDGINWAGYPRRRSDFMLVGADVGGSEFGQIYRLDFQTRDLTLLTDGKSRNGGAVWSWGGDVFMYTSTRRNGRDNDFYVMNPLDPASDRLLLERDGGGWGILGFSRDDKQVLFGRYISVESGELWLMNADGTNVRKIAPAEGRKVSYDGGVVLGDGATVLTSSDGGGEFTRLVLLDVATGVETPLTPEIPWDVEGYSVSTDQKLVAYAINEAGRSVLRLMDLERRLEIPLPGLPSGQIGGFSFRPNGRELSFVLNSARSPGEIWSVHVETGEVTRWTTAEGAMSTRDFVEPKLIEWKSFDGLSISGWLYAPDPGRHPGKRPVYISIHGGPEGQARPGFMGRMNYLINELGIAVIFPNVRGSTGFGRTFVSLDNGMKREDSVRDIGALLDWIKTQDNLDADRICVTGGSYGGYMTLASAVHYSDRIRCAISSVGISHFVTFLESTQAYRRDLRRVEYGDERDPEMRKFLHEISPLTRVDSMNVPMMIVQGANDPRVPVGESEQIVQSLKGRGIEVWYLLGLDEGHGFAKKDKSDFQFFATIEFLRRHLLN